MQSHPLRRTWHELMHTNGEQMGGGMLYVSDQWTMGWLGKKMVIASVWSYIARASVQIKVIGQKWGQKNTGKQGVNTWWNMNQTQVSKV